MFNKVIIVGNLTRDVEMRYLPSGSAVATLGLASNRRYNKQDGTKGEETCFVDVRLFGRTAEIANQYLHKGSKILIEGRLVLESWNDQSGQKRSKHSIVAETMQMLDSKAQNQDSAQYANQDQYGNYEGNYSNFNDGYAQGNAHSNYGNDSRHNTSNQNTNKESATPAKNGGSYQENIPSINIDDDEIPF